VTEANERYEAAVKKKGRFLLYLEYFVVRLGIAVAQAMSFRAGVRMAELIGAILFHCDGRHRKIAIENLRHAFGDSMSEAERRRLAKASFQHIVAVGVEMAHMHRIVTRRNWRRYIDVVHPEHAREAAARGRGVIFVTGHLGNWEVCGQAISLLGFPLRVVMRPMDNPLLDEIINRFRRTRQKPIPKDGALRTLVRTLREGQYLAIVADQDARDDGVFVNFFGRPASTVKSVAALSLRMGSPIVTGYTVRPGDDFRFTLFVDEPLYPEATADHDEDIRRLTQQFTVRIESYVRKFPHRWLWMHRRWKTRPAGES